MENTCILVVEDNTEISKYIKSTLTIFSKLNGCKYEVTLAHDGVQGLELAWELHPDVIVLDIEMPRLDGYGVLTSLRTMGNTTPVIMMTANPQEEDHINRSFLGHNAYIAKPFFPDLLYHHIQKQLRRRTQHISA